jgi:hypothetical protein
MAHDEMHNISCHSEIPLLTYSQEWLNVKRVTVPSVGNVEQLELSYIVQQKIKWCNHLEISLSLMIPY